MENHADEKSVEPASEIKDQDESLKMWLLAIMNQQDEHAWRRLEQEKETQHAMTKTLYMQEMALRSQIETLQSQQWACFWTALSTLLAGLALTVSIIALCRSL